MNRMQTYIEKTMVVDADDVDRIYDCFRDMIIGLKCHDPADKSQVAESQAAVREYLAVIRHVSGLQSVTRHFDVRDLANGNVEIQFGHIMGAFADIQHDGKSHWVEA